MVRFFRSLWFRDAVEESAAGLTEHPLIVKLLDAASSKDFVSEQDPGQRGQEHRRRGFHIDVVAKFSAFPANLEEFSKQHPALNNKGPVIKSTGLLVAQTLSEQFAKKRDAAAVLIDDYPGQNAQFVFESFARHSEVWRLGGSGHEFEFAFQNGLEDVVAGMVVADDIEGRDSGGPAELIQRNVLQRMAFEEAHGPIEDGALLFRI